MLEAKPKQKSRGLQTWSEFKQEARGHVRASGRVEHVEVHKQDARRAIDETIGSQKLETRMDRADIARKINHKACAQSEAKWMTTKKEARTRNG